MIWRAGILMRRRWRIMATVGVRIRPHSYRLVANSNTKSRLCIFWRYWRMRMMSRLIYATCTLTSRLARRSQHRRAFVSMKSPGTNSNQWLTKLIAKWKYCDRRRRLRRSGTAARLIRGSGSERKRIKMLLKLVRCHTLKDSLSVPWKHDWIE